MVFASSITDGSYKGSPAANGIVFEGSSGTVYGNVTVSRDITAQSENSILTVPQGASLNIVDGVTLTNITVIRIAGDFAITGGLEGTDYSFAGGVLTVSGERPLTISMKPGVDTTGNRIVVGEDICAKITLAGVHIETSTGAPLDFSSANTSTLTLADGTVNTLKATGQAAGLLIKTFKLTVDGGGTLNVYGGNRSAGIGGAGNTTLRIDGGIINAYGGTGAAGIGGGAFKNGGIITINGGTINAYGGDATNEYGSGAGIGSGTKAVVDDDIITINGGTVFAKAGDSDPSYGHGGNAGIGGGEGGYVDLNSGCTVIINGGAIINTGEIQYAVAWSLNGVTHNKGANVTYASSVDGYAAILTAGQDYKLPANITVTVGETVLTNGVTYNAETGALSIVAAKITGPVTVSADGVPTYAVTLTSGTGYTLAAKDGSSSPVECGGSYTFTFALDAAYSASNYTIKVNGTSITLTGDEYTIENITEAKTVTVEGVENIISVDITWGAMEFTYSGGEWNPDTHEYDGAGWVCDSENGNRITVTNNSTRAVTASFGYTQTIAGITGSFTDGANPIISPVNVPKDETVYVYFVPTGAIDSSQTTATTLGRITVTIG